MRPTLLIALLLICCPVHASAGQVDASLEKLKAAIESRWSDPAITDALHAKNTAEKYFELFGTTAEPASLTNDQLHAWLEAAYTAHFYSVEPEILEDLVRIASELESREALADKHAQWLHGAFVAERRFEQANQWNASHAAVEAPEVPLLPNGVGNLDPAPTALAVLGEPLRFEKRILDIGNGKQVVIAASPICYFTQQAFAAIAGDPDLEAAIEGAILLDRPSSFSHFEKFAEWNEQYPAFPIHPVVRLEGWNIPHWDTPRFYFMNDGDIVAEVVGWPKGGRKDELLTAAAKLAEAE